jgi:chromosomal replication initiation ATPase DnaA
MSSAIGTAGTAELWSAALEQLERRYSKPIFEMWLKPMRLVELGPHEIALSVHSTFARHWVDSRLKNDIADVLNGLLGGAIALRFIVADSAENGSDARAHAPAAQIPPPGELRLGNLNPRGVASRRRRAGEGI